MENLFPLFLGGFLAQKNVWSVAEDLSKGSDTDYSSYLDKNNKDNDLEDSDTDLNLLRR